MFSSLRGRIFLASALLAVLSIAVAIYLVSVRVTTTPRPYRTSPAGTRIS
jgi:hypothetical protein